MAEVNPSLSVQDRKRTIGRFVGRLFSMLVILILLMLIAGAVAKANLRAKFPAPGELIDIGGFSLQIYCQGEGSPTVVMEAGSGDFSLTWSLVQPELARTTRVCVYDRAGLGWSEPSPEPQTALHSMEELHALLELSGTTGPYVLVGHSFGGMIVRLYADAYPHEVVGMVLVDSSHAEQLSRSPEAVQAALQHLASQYQQQLGFFKFLSTTGIIALAPSRVPVQGNLPEDVAMTYRSLVASHDAYFDTLSAEIEAQEESFAQIREANITSLGDIPLIVLSAGQPDHLPASPDISASMVDEFESVWRQLQAELAELSTRGRLVVAEQSGHYIQLDQPELVIDAILQVVADVRREMQ